jgi:hypothetical protein
MINIIHDHLRRNVPNPVVDIAFNALKEHISNIDSMPEENAAKIVEILKSLAKWMEENKNKILEIIANLEKQKEKSFAFYLLTFLLTTFCEQTEVIIKTLKGEI